MTTEFLKTLKPFIQLEKIQTDNNVFKLHYKATVILLLGFSFLLTGKQYFGDPMDCDVDERKEVIDTYCWIYGTFTLKSSLKDPHIPGLGHAAEYDSTTINRHNYYQWVGIVFFIQGIIFYIPRYLWKTWESGRLKFLVNGLESSEESSEESPPPAPTFFQNWKDGTKSRLVTYLLQGQNNMHNIYTMRYSCCEVLNFINVIGQICFMDWFVTGKFSMYGIAYTTYRLYKEVNPMDEVFPKITKCVYYRIGMSGTQEVRDALCILPLNILNQNFFLILWYWFYILLLISLLAVVVYLLRAQTRSLDKKKSRIVIENITYGDFFILYKIGKNVNPILYKELVEALYEQIIGKEPFYKNIPQSTLIDA
ncbi:hypothetical protein NQ315_001886 [Exocentrus adspersus]|uniref:Innexin n=1 Tax=Exocentrus adspersus TaxID=1586481 RepID=A0AAV8WAJ0_9CUCU|nr:hypothetical protein NQ315_001886 [Exocentrus adspersus]